MTFDEIIVDVTLKEKLRGIIASGRVPHAIMFLEDDGGGGFAVVDAFLSEFYAESERHLISKMMHPDVYYLFPTSASDRFSGTDVTCANYFPSFSAAVLENPYITRQNLNVKMGIGLKGNFSIGVKEIEKIVPKISYMPIRADKKVVVIYLPENLTADSANKLLKSIEEPPQNTYFLLITQDEAKVMKTVSSRCSRFRIPPLNTAQQRVVRERYLKNNEATQNDEFFLLAGKIFSAVTDKDLPSALEAYEQVEQISNKEDKKAFCRYLSVVLRNLFLMQQGLTGLIDLPQEQCPFFELVSKKLKKTFVRKAMEELNTTLYYLERNVSSGMAFCDLILKFYRLA